MNSTKLLASASDAVTLFVDEKLEDDQTSFTFPEAEALAGEVGIHVSTIIRLAQEAGLTYTGRAVPKVVRGFTSNNHNRYEGNPMAGGSGWEQIAGFAGPKG